MPNLRHLPIWIASLLAAAALLLSSHGGLAQPIGQPSPEPNIEAALVAEGPVQPGEELLLAIRFRPDEGWHGYWKNPGDAGYGMELDWELPGGWQAGEPRYPVPTRLEISGLMNHVFKGEYAVLIPVSVPADAETGSVARIALDAQWLACTDIICVPERDRLELAIAVGGTGEGDSRFAGWQGAIPPLLDSEASFAQGRGALRIAFPMPASLEVTDPHVFIENTALVRYAAVQTYYREGDLLVAEIPLQEGAALPDELGGILSFREGEGVTFAAVPGEVPQLGKRFGPMSSDMPGLGWLLLAALGGGLLLNILPCVFPILSLKALTLARVGESASQARREGLAYAAGVILACLALGGLLLLLRAGGEQVGWAFQLQEPSVVVALLLLAVAITANLAGVFALPNISIAKAGEPSSAFATGLLAAFVATPCTGPFMAAALGAALVLPVPYAIALFAALGLGIALPFLAIAFIPALRERLPRPGPWMERFRRLMAVPMGLTALALVWLVARVGGQGFGLMTMVLVFGLLLALVIVGKLQARGKLAWPAFWLVVAPFAIFAAFALPASFESSKAEAAESIHDPVEFSDAALAEARASGRPVFVWFTADWCLTCKVNESVAIEREATREAFEQADVIAMRGDWTRRDAEIAEFLADQGAAGVPLYLWYEPGAGAETLPQVLTASMLVEKARDSARSGAPEAGSD